MSQYVWDFGWPPYFYHKDTYRIKFSSDIYFFRILSGMIVKIVYSKSESLLLLLLLLLKGKQINEELQWISFISAFLKLFSGSAPCQQFTLDTAPLQKISIFCYICICLMIIRITY